MNWLAIILLAYPVLFTLQCAYNLVSNYLLARKYNLPWVFCPIHAQWVPWIVAGPIFFKQLRDYLPNFIFDRLRMTIYGWELHYKQTPHHRWGGKYKSFLLVNCGTPELWIGDPDLTEAIMKRNYDFRLSTLGAMIMGKFGSNLVISQDATWQRQRKFIAPNINERVAATVFQESKTQAETMMDFFTRAKALTDDSAESLKRIAINVLGAAGYGQRRDWTPGKDNDKAPPGFHVTYMQAMRLLMDNLVEMAFLPTAMLLLPFMPDRLQKTGHSVKELAALTKILLEQSSTSTRASITSQIAQETSKAEKEKSSTTLHEDEIVGNLFVFSAAGTDTTANTMAYAMVLLAIHPEWQDWICEELDQVLADKGDDLEYNDVHPKLIRTLSIMVSFPASPLQTPTFTTRPQPANLTFSL
jgi:cytochrome P450